MPNENINSVSNEDFLELWGVREAAEKRHRRVCTQQASSHNKGVLQRFPWTLDESDITTPQLTEWLINKRGKPCPFCGREATHIDHKTPLSKDGTHSWDNIWMLCKTCNLGKSDMTVEEYVQWLDDLVKYRTRNTK
jgi:5-methylcytosine-specific restriction endonuclease McrA